MTGLDRETLAERAAAIERHLDRVAARLPTSPDEPRRGTDAADAVVLNLWQALQVTIDLAIAAWPSLQARGAGYLCGRIPPAW